MGIKTGYRFDLTYEGLKYRIYKEAGLKRPGFDLTYEGLKCHIMKRFQRRLSVF